MKYYILDMAGNIVPMPFETSEEAEQFGLNGGWDKFIIIKMIKVVSA